MRSAWTMLRGLVLCAAICGPRAAAQNSTFALANTTTQLSSSVASPLVGQATTLTARIVPDAGSSTAGGTYVPGAPGGTVTFMDGRTTLGMAPLVADSLTFATATPQTINASAIVSAQLSRTARARTPVRPKATPSPDNSSGFSSIVADFNMDGFKDALLFDQGAGTFHLLLGSSPAGNFQPEHAFASGCQYLSGVTVADLNGDGFPDIAYLCLNDDNSSSLFALYGLGEGTFAPAVLLLGATGAPLLQSGSQIGSGDVNRDGKVDLVVTGLTSVPGSPVTYGIQTFLGDGAGHFTPGPITSTAGDPGTQLVVTDVNNDGALDLVLLSSSYQSYVTMVQPYRNNGTGNFTTSPPIPVCDCYTYTSKLFVTPLTSNAAYPDIAVAVPDQEQVLVSLNPRTSASVFGAPIATSIPRLADAVVGDLNGDGLVDLAVFDGTSISVLNGDGAGGFATQASTPNFTSTGYSVANVSLVAAADFNQDGYADLLTLYPGPTFTSTINTYLTTGSAVATLPATFSSVGAHQLSAMYPGNPNLLGSTGALPLTVQSYMASIAIAAPPSNTPGLSATQVYTPGASFSLNFTLTRSNNPAQGQSFPSPGGAITVTEGNVSRGTVSVQASGPNTSSAALVNFESATAGNHVLTIAYSGDSNFQPLTTTFTFVVTQAAPTVTWTTPATIDTNNALDGTLLSATASVPGTFAYTPSSGYLLAGIQSITALFTPTDGVDYQTVSTVRSFNVVKANPNTITLAASPANQTYLSAIPTVLTATVTGINLNPTGLVQFFDGSMPIGSSSLAGASASAVSAAATLTLSALAAGPHAFHAVYAGDNTYTSATSNTLSYFVQTMSSTTLAVSSVGNSVSSVPAGSVISLTATVPATSGQVNFCDASAAFCTDIHLLGSAQLTAAGTATVRFIPAIGNHSYRAIFLGTTDGSPSSSAAVPLAVTGLYPTTTTLSATGTSPTYNLLATVTGSGGSPLLPGGNVAFLDANNANNPLATLLLGPVTTTQSFVAQPSGSQGSFVGPITTGDFNGDGIPDLITVDPAGSFSVLLGVGDGTFTLQARVSVPVGQVVAGDFNRDGNLDLAVTSSAGNAFYFFAGNGDGTFTSAPSMPLPAGSQTLVAGDFNRDGFLDLATGSTAGNGGGVLTLLLGHGDGSFTTSQSATPTPIGLLATGDLNGDGVLDLVSGFGQNSALSILLGKGDGTFTPTSTVTTGSFPIAVVIADFNGDGVADLAAANFYDDSLTVLLGKRDGTFTQGTSPSTIDSGGANAHALAVADLNQDGIPDLAVTTDSGISLYFGVGDGTFMPFGTALPQSDSDQQAGHEDFGLAIADLNGDGLPDLVTTAPEVRVALNTVAATATASASGISLVGSGGHSVTASYLGDANFAASVSAPASLTGQALIPQLTFSPPAVALTYGAPLPAVLFNATVTAPGGGSIVGAITYNHAPGDVLNAGSQTVTATFTPADLLTYTTVSVSRTIPISRTTPILAFSPNPAAIIYGTPISSAQLNATVTSTYIPVVSGTFTYAFAPAFTTIPSAGTTTITATFTPTDLADFTSATATASVSVAKATPTISFPVTPMAVVGSPLSGLQLAPTVTGVAGATLPGTLSYLPNTGLVVSGPQTLSLTFTPIDLADYNSVNTQVTLTGTPVTLNALSSSSALLGDPAKTITLTGTGFVTNSVARANGTALATTYVSPTSLTAVLPAGYFLALQTLQITVFNPTQSQTTAALPFTVIPAPVGAISFTGPTVANSGDQPSIQFALTNPYPVGLTATLTLSFSPIAGGVDDPAIQFKDGGRAFSFNLAAGQTVSPNIQLQSGTVAGTIQITLALYITSGGANVTPASIAPLIITIPPAAPVITSMTLTRTGNQLTVNTYGLANTRAISQAAFHFTPASGQQIQTQDITLDVNALFNAWYSQAISATYGSTFLYTQTFTLDEDATVVGQVTVTLSNGVGVSASGSSN